MTWLYQKIINRCLPPFQQLPSSMWAFSSASATNTSFRILVRCFCISHSPLPLTTTTLATKASPFTSSRFGALTSMDSHNNNFSSFSAASARSRPSGDSGRGKGLETRDDKQRSGGHSRGGGAPKDKIDALGRLLTRILRHMASELNLDMRSDGYVRVQDLLKLNLKTFANIPLRSHSVDDIREKSTLENSTQISNGRLCAPLQDVPYFLGLKHENEVVQKPDSRLRIFSGTANLSLAQEVAKYMGVDLGKITIKRFADGEVYVQLQESVRGCDVFLVQPTCTPVNEHLVELLVMIDACRRASAKTITAVIPYFGYARADRMCQGRESIAAKLVANMITEAGATRVLACDVHSGQSLGYFDIPIDHVLGQPVILDYLASKMGSSNDMVVVSPDVGGVSRARAYAKKLSDAPLAIVDKRRHGHNVSEVMNLIGDVKGKVAVMVDDMIDTAGTISNAADLLHQEGAKAVYACCTHAVFSPPALERLSCGLFQEVITTNTIPIAEENYFPQLTVLSVANILAEAILRVHDDGSVSSMFQ